jgi:hypothetical protein
VQSRRENVAVRALVGFVVAAVALLAAACTAARQVPWRVDTACRPDVLRDLLLPLPGFMLASRLPLATAGHGLGAQLRNVSAAEVPERSQARRTMLMAVKGLK